MRMTCEKCLKTYDGRGNSKYCVMCKVDVMGNHMREYGAKRYREMKKKRDVKETTKGNI